MGKPRRPFTRELKVKAVKAVTEQRRSFAEAVANLGIAESLLRKWKQNLDAQGDPRPSPAKAISQPSKKSCAVCGPRISGCRWNASL